MPQGTYTAVGLPTDGTTIEAADVTVDILGLINEFNKNIDNNKIEANAGINFSKLEAAAWTTWTPTYTGSGIMTYTGVTTNAAVYFKIGKAVIFTLDAIGTTGGTSAAFNSVGFSTPSTMKRGFGVIAVCTVADANTIGGFARPGSVTSCNVFRSDGQAYFIGANVGIRALGIYEEA